MTDWYELKSLIITSNLEFSQWNRIFTDARLTAALVDRMIHHSHILSFTGDSLPCNTHCLITKHKNQGWQSSHISFAFLSTFILQNTIALHV
ncbi:MULTISPECIES: ATP-binding protein [Siminovitchia]|uniref:ATP-binding protein n=1 Tax=Siminovitchia TaxID=2837510 RepID=UPI00209A6B50|nr:ATP-binding protein [Siminovitchia thermophila]